MIRGRCPPRRLCWTIGRPASCFATRLAWDEINTVAGGGSKCPTLGRRMTHRLGGVIPVIARSGSAIWRIPLQDADPFEHLGIVAFGSRTIRYQVDRLRHCGSSTRPGDICELAASLFLTRDVPAIARTFQSPWINSQVCHLAGLQRHESPTEDGSIPFLMRLVSPTSRLRMLGRFNKIDSFLRRRADLRGVGESIGFTQGD